MNAKPTPKSTEFIASFVNSVTVWTFMADLRRSASTAQSRRTVPRPLVFGGTTRRAA